MAMIEQQRCRTRERRHQEFRARALPPIILVADFGDFLAIGECRTAIAQTNEQIGLTRPVDVIPVPDVQKFNKTHGAFNLAQLAKNAPAGSVLVGVVDPEVGTKREGIIITTEKNHTFVGPNNGILYPAAASEGIKKAWVIDESRFSHKPTFHGRDIFAKVATLLVAGKDPSLFSAPFEKDRLIELAFKPGQIVHVDSYGNLKINSEVPEGAYALEIETETQPFRVPMNTTFEDVPLGSFLAYPGSSDLLEIAVREGNAAQLIQAKIGDCLNITWQTPINTPLV